MTSVSPTVRINVSGARGESQADILRRTGRYGVVPTDTDDQAMAKLNAAAEASAANAEAFTGPTYATVAGGLAGTTDGDYFAVNNAGIVTVYRNTAGSAVYQRDAPTTAAFASSAPGRGASMLNTTSNIHLQEFIDYNIAIPVIVDEGADAADAIEAAWLKAKGLGVGIRLPPYTVGLSRPVGANVVYGTPGLSKIRNLNFAIFSVGGNPRDKMMLHNEHFAIAYNDTTADSVFYEGFTIEVTPIGSATWPNGNPMNPMGLANVKWFTMSLVHLTALRNLNTSVTPNVPYRIENALDIYASVHGGYVSNSSFNQLTGAFGATRVSAGGGDCISVRNICGDGALADNVTCNITFYNCTLRHFTSDECLAIYGVQGKVFGIKFVKCNFYGLEPADLGLPASEAVYNTTFISIFPLDDGGASGSNAAAYGNLLEGNYVETKNTLFNVIRIGNSTARDLVKVCKSNVSRANEVVVKLNADATYGQQALWVSNNSATFIGRIDNNAPGVAGQTLTVTQMLTGAIAANMSLASTPGVAAGTRVVSLTGTGTGGVGTYPINVAQTLPAGTNFSGSPSTTPNSDSNSIRCIEGTAGLAFPGVVSGNVSEDDKVFTTSNSGEINAAFVGWQKVKNPTVRGNIFNSGVSCLSVDGGTLASRRGFTNPGSQIGGALKWTGTDPSVATNCFVYVDSPTASRVQVGAVTVTGGACTAYIASGAHADTVINLQGVTGVQGGTWPGVSNNKAGATIKANGCSVAGATAARSGVGNFDMTDNTWGSIKDPSAVAPTSGAGAPSTTPSGLGLFYTDNSATPKKVYMSTGTLSSADWTPLN